MRMTSVVCNVPVLSQNDSTYHHSVFATWTPSFIILVRKLKKFPKIPTDGCMAIPALAGLLVIIRSLLQKEINYDQVYPKIYQPYLKSTSSLHYLVKFEQECIGQHCWHDFVIKDVTVKQVTLNVTDVDKINIVSSQAVLEMPSFSTDTRSMSSLPLVNSLVKKSTVQDRTRHRWAAVLIYQHYEYISLW